MLKSIKKYKVIVLFLLLAFFAGGIFLWNKNSERKISANSQAIQKNPEKFSENVFPTEKKKLVKILFLGDLMFDRYIRQVAEKKGNEFIFEKVKKILSENDLTVANLEGPISDNISKSINTQIGEKNHLVFTFDKSLAGTLFGENIKLVNLGNNHILNFGSSGLDSTKKYLSEAGVEYFGDNNVVIKNINGMRIGFINYNQFCGSRDAKSCVSTTIENIKNTKNQADFVVVYTHWGTEYYTGIKENLRNIAHDFIDSGADLVIGSHPHVVELSEDYKGKRIYYSLGNFIFDQYFSKDTKKGLGIVVTIDPDSKSMKFQEINLILKTNGQTAADGL